MKMAMPSEGGGSREESSDEERKSARTTREENQKFKPFEDWCEVLFENKKRKRTTKSRKL